MKYRLVAAGLSLLLTAFGAAAAPEVTTLSQFPNGTFLENGEVDRDGALYFTSYLERRIYVQRPGRPVKVFAQLEVHPVAVLLGPKQIVVSAHGQPFTAGPAFTQTQQLLLLGRDGKLQRSVRAPDARFLNGMTRSGGAVLVADSIAATVWRFDPAAGSVSAWLQHEALSQDPAVKAFKPGANGIKRVGDTLWLSNSSRGSLLRVALAGDKPQGEPQRVASLDGIDDFTVLADGSVIAASHAEKLYRVGRDGVVSDLMASGCGACTAVLPVPAVKGQAPAYYVLTTGGLLEGGKEPAKVLRVSAR